jgi:hypothetical protein
LIHQWRGSDKGRGQGIGTLLHTDVCAQAIRAREARRWRIRLRLKSTRAILLSRAITFQHGITPFLPHGRRIGIGRNELTDAVVLLLSKGAAAIRAICGLARQQAAAMEHSPVAMAVGLRIERPQRLHDVVEQDRRAARF